MSNDRFIPTPEEIELGWELDREFPRSSDATRWAAHLIRDKGWTKLAPEVKPRYGYAVRTFPAFIGGRIYELVLYKDDQVVSAWAYDSLFGIGTAQLHAKIKHLVSEYGAIKREYVEVKD